jgi:hypothetical protein
MDREKLRKCYLSLHGQLVCLGGPIAIVMTAFELARAYKDHWLTWDAALRIAGASILSGIVASVVVWYLVMRPFIRSQAKQKDS